MKMHNHYFFHRLFISLLLSFYFFSSSVQADTIRVTKKTDSFDGHCNSDCSLREAIWRANRTPGAHYINLDEGEYQLTLPPPYDANGEELLEDETRNGDLDIKGQIFIKGADTGTTIINANQLDRHFTVLSKATFVLKKLTLINGKNANQGGSIMNLATLVIEHCIFKNNHVESSLHMVNGGAIANYANLRIQRSEFINNFAHTTNNQWSNGGAIHNNMNLFVRDTVFRENRVTSDPRYGHGGAISSTNNADIARSIFIGNKATGGGMAIFSMYDMKLSNITVSGNLGENPYRMGALESIGKISIINSTIVNNQGGSGVQASNETLIRNSIILNNYAAPRYATNSPAPSNCDYIGSSEQLTTRGLLLGEGNTECTGELYVEDENTFTQVLAPLAKNNYHMETHALLPNSPAIDAGIGSCSAHDQRWQPRPVDGNADGVPDCDLGSFEHQTSD